MNQREKLIELLDIAFLNSDDNYGMPNTEQVADYLLDNGVVLPCRCENCECGYNWMNDGTGKIGKCAFLIGDNQYVVADGFCNLGERKGGDE